MNQGHQWTKPTRLVDCTLSTCLGPCKTLRVTFEDGRPTRYIRRIADPALRIIHEEPPCVHVPPGRRGE